MDGECRELRTPPVSPTLPLSRQPRSPTLHRACSRARRSRSRSSRRSMGRPSQFSTFHEQHHSRQESEGTHSRDVRSRSAHHSPDIHLSRRAGDAQAVCMYRRSERASNRRSRSGLRSPRHTHDNRTCNPSSTLHPKDSHQCGNGRSENPSLVELVENLVSANNTSFNKLGPMYNNTIPEFDPSRKEQTMNMWLHKVNECAIIYSWSDKQINHFALQKLQGTAKRWYESLPSVLYTWDEWQQKLRSAFPSDENYGQMLSDMLARRARYTDSLEDYFYDKMTLLNRCGVEGKRAVECIIHGIDDRSVKLGAEAAQFNNPDKLLSYLRNAKYFKPKNERRMSKIQTPRNPENVVSLAIKPPKCSNCKADGHKTFQCTLPLKKCNRCGRTGHDTEQCYAKIPVSEKLS